VLPLSKVRLYESGVAYYERVGEVGDGGASLPVPASHLDDAIKTLVIFGEDGEVQHLAFDSHLGLAVARARAGLPPDVEEKVGIREILASLRGAQVRIEAGKESINGRLVDVVEVAPTDPQWASGDASDAEVTSPRPQIQAVVFGDNGEFRRFDLAEISSVAPTDPELRRRYEAALDTDAAQRSGSRDVLSVVGETGGVVKLGYLAETPVWRTSFRLVFDPEDRGSAHLQGWALVHNDTDEDWERVGLELVNGRPDSFLFPLAAPRYERRTLETPPDPMSSVPQLLLESPDMMWGDFSDLMGQSGVGGGVGYGYGSGAGFGGRGRRVPKVRTAKARVSGPTASDLLDLGDLAKVVGASGDETETLFVYTSDTSLDLGAHRSAMVPFISEAIAADPVVFFSLQGGEARHGVRVVNSTNKTLPEGPISVFADGGFSGESFLTRLKPGERQFLQIGQDPDSELTVVEVDREHVPKRITFENHRLEVHYLEIVTRELSFNNRSGRTREALVALPIGRNAQVEGADALDFESSSATPLAKFTLETGRSKARRLVTTVALARGHNPSDVGDEFFELHAGDERLPEATRDALRAAQARARAYRLVEASLAAISGRIAEVDQDIERIRGHLKSAGGGDAGAAGSARLVNRLLTAEDKRGRWLEERRAGERELAGAREAIEESLEVLQPAP
jgi:hypothetical protein